MMEAKSKNLEPKLSALIVTGGNGMAAKRLANISMTTLPAATIIQDTPPKNHSMSRAAVAKNSGARVISNMRLSALNTAENIIYTYAKYILKTARTLKATMTPPSASNRILKKVGARGP